MTNNDVGTEMQKFIVVYKRNGVAKKIAIEKNESEYLKTLAKKET